MGGAELSIYLAMIDVQKKLKELEAKVSVLWLANQMAIAEVLLENPENSEKKGGADDDLPF